MTPRCERRARLASRSRRRLWGFRATAFFVASVLVVTTARWIGTVLWEVGEWKASTSIQIARRVPNPGETLRVACVARAPYCAQMYGHDIPFCHRADCDTATGLTTTPQGFVGPRGRWYDDKPPAGTIRILTLGGSTTGGSPWERSWPGNLERLLRERASREGVPLRFEVLNLGISGGTSRDSWMLFDGIGRRFAPQVVILGEEVNDFGGCVAFGTSPDPVTGATAEELVADVLAGRRDATELARISPWFARHQGAFARAAAERATERRIATLRDAVWWSPARAQRLVGIELEQACAGASDELESEAESIFDDFSEGFAATRTWYEKIRTAAASDGVSTLVVSTVPHAFESWKCPTPSCAPILSLHDWYRFITRVHNPGIREYARTSMLTLVDLELEFDRFGRDDAQPVASELEPNRPVVAGSSGKAALFAWEWMHPSDDGYRLVASLYAAALWPVVTGSGR